MVTTVFNLLRLPRIIRDTPETTTQPHEPVTWRDTATSALALLTGMTAITLLTAPTFGWTGTAFALALAATDAGFFHLHASRTKPEERTSPEFQRFRPLVDSYSQKLGIPSPNLLTLKYGHFPQMLPDTIGCGKTYLREKSDSTISFALGHELGHMVYGWYPSTLLTGMTRFTGMAYPFITGAAILAAPSIPLALGAIAAGIPLMLITRQAYNRHVENVCDRIGTALTGHTEIRNCTRLRFERFNPLPRTASEALVGMFSHDHPATSFRHLATRTYLKRLPPEHITRAREQIARLAPTPEKAQPAPLCALA